MNAVKAVLRARNKDVESMTVGETVSIEPRSDVLMPLVIEKTDENELSVGHFYTQLGDLMSDPEILFEIRGEDWIPTKYIQDPTIERHDPEGLDLEAFLNLWNRNIRRQGYIEPD